MNHLREAWRKLAERVQHRPSGPPLHDLLEEELFPENVYTHPHYYVFGDHGGESIRVVQQVRGNPDAMVTIYRSVSGTVKEPIIETGDWVALAEGYARDHGMGQGWDEWVEGDGWVRREDDWPVMAAQVPARFVINGGNDLIEWGYVGPSVRGRWL